jgi:predicted enzyme related to lactoylglutathione lyase
MKLELVPIPVTDVERAKAFYADQVGFHLDHDVQHTGDVRVIQLTPPGSGCSIVIGTGMAMLMEMQPGSIRGLHLVVDDIEVARSELVKRGVAMGAVVDMGGVKYAGFSDPDGNTWTLQEISRRA